MEVTFAFNQNGEFVEDKEKSEALKDLMIPK